MAKISKDLGVGTLHPRETLYLSGSLGGAGAELIVAADGAASVSLDLRGTFSLTIDVSGSVDGINWAIIPMRPVNAATLAYLTGISGSASGVFVGKCAQYRMVRARVTSYVSGAAVATLAADPAMIDDSIVGSITPGLVTAVGTAGASLTLTLPPQGSSLRHYITYLSINRFAATALTAAAAPVTLTTTNLPGALAFTFAADALALGGLDRWREDFAFPLATLTPNTATTIVCPAVTGVIWRATAGFYVGP